ncbi:hypothetical protein BJ878DRAFT_501498 [Calycina marina]|uniref:LCCL domain-containing protein n=1 Tax=Calycina marina TaxID=1763456 RepID=A0A9P8CG35_9HELO|nr:hypothetical protein BJ878DRAFT_501498 [Calycina marina]
MARNDDATIGSRPVAEGESSSSSDAETSRRDTESLPLEDLSEDSSPPTPRFIQDQRNRYIKWVPLPIKRVSKVVVKWAKGPQPPRIHKIKPYFPNIQEYPIRFLEKYTPKRRYRVLLLLWYYFFWIFAFVLVTNDSKAATDIGGYGTPITLGCGSTFWTAKNLCGVNGNSCRPFNGTGAAFRCPASCITQQVLNSRAVGSYEAIYQPFVIGGPPSDGELPVYRGDSFICSAAIHAGTINNKNGGCGVLAQVGDYQNYISSTRNGITSIPFDSNFPSSFAFYQPADCPTDPRWKLLYISVAFSAVFSLFTTSASVFFFTIFIALFFHVGLASDPALETSSVATQVSDLLGKLLPSMFIAFVMYRYMGIRRTLTDLTAQVEKTVLWLGGCWIGALNNYTFDNIPISRLNAHDLKQQPGAIAALTIIVIVLIIIFGLQIWFFRQEGRLIRYLGLYAFLILCILMLLTIPGLSFRLHHYILALLLLSGTSMQTLPSLLFQGILVGLFMDGIARWGYDSILQTAAALQGDAQYDSTLPVILAPVIALATNVSSISFSWKPPPSPFEGVSVLVNDVERFRGFVDDDVFGDSSFTWTKESDFDAPQYFRFGYMKGTNSYDYTRAGIWTANGTWIQMPIGPSRVRSRSIDRYSQIIGL